MSDGLLLLLFQLHLVLPLISIHDLDRFLDRFLAAVQEGRDGIFGRGVGAGARGVVFVLLHRFGDVRCSDDWGTHGAWVWHLVLFLYNGGGQGLDELPLIACMAGWGVGRRSSTGGRSSFGWGSSTGGGIMATGTGGGSRMRVFSWHLGTVCSGLVVGRCIRWWIGSNWWFKVNC